MILPIYLSHNIYHLTAVWWSHAHAHTHTHACTHTETRQHAHSHAHKLKPLAETTDCAGSRNAWGPLSSSDTAAPGVLGPAAFISGSNGSGQLWSWLSGNSRGEKPILHSTFLCYRWSRNSWLDNLDNFNKLVDVLCVWEMGRRRRVAVLNSKSIFFNIQR